jgi:hypothetical protein
LPSESASETLGFPFASVDGTALLGAPLEAGFLLDPWHDVSTSAAHTSATG